MRLHAADKAGQGTPRAKPIEADADSARVDEGARAALARAVHQLQLKDRRCLLLEAEAARVAKAKTKAPPPSCGRL